MLAFVSSSFRLATPASRHRGPVAAARFLVPVGPPPGARHLAGALVWEHNRSMRVLVVEDEWKVAEALREGLEAERYEVVVERTGEAAFVTLTAEAFDVILLDLTLPSRDGLEVLRTIRAKGVQTPVLALTARDTVSDRVAGLDAGADDYLVKPFAFAEMLARIRVLMRRGRVSEVVPRLTVADLTIDLIARKVTRNKKDLDLTVREFELLYCLMRSAGQVVSRDMLACEVWNEVSRTSSLDNIIDVYAARLRRKVDLDGSVKLIHTIRGVGFLFRDGDP